jgi:hypothetical protein
MSQTKISPSCHLPIDVQQNHRLILSSCLATSQFEKRKLHLNCSMQIKSWRLHDHVILNPGRTNTVGRPIEKYHLQPLLNI